MALTPRVRAWVEAGLLAIAPWLLGRWPTTVPIAVAAALLLHPPWRRSASDPAAAALIAASAAGALALAGGWGEAGAWMLLAVLVAGVATTLPRPARRPDAADLVALLGWGGAFLVAPASLGDGFTRPFAALLLVLAARRLARAAGVVAGRLPAPPRVEVEGWLRLEAAVPADDAGLPVDRPLSLELEPGSTLAVLVSPERAEHLAALLAGRRAPAAGRVLVDGRELAAGAGLAAVVAPGEAFVPGGLEDNLQLLTADELAPDTLLAAREACALEDVEVVLEDADLAPDGEPLSALQRLRVLAARALVSDCRLLVAVDPAPWGRPAEVAAWHAALVRASVGRTALWLTPDRALAARAQRVLELEAVGAVGPAALRPVGEPAADVGGGSA